MKSTFKKRYTRFVALLAVGIIAIGTAHAVGWWDDDDQLAQVTELEQPDMADENVAKFSGAAVLLLRFLQLPHIPVHHLPAPFRFPAAVRRPCDRVLRAKHSQSLQLAEYSHPLLQSPAAAAPRPSAEPRRHLAKYRKRFARPSAHALRIQLLPARREPNHKIVRAFLGQM